MDQRKPQNLLRPLEDQDMGCEAYLDDGDTTLIGRVLQIKPEELLMIRCVVKPSFLQLLKEKRHLRAQVRVHDKELRRAMRGHLTKDSWHGGRREGKKRGEEQRGRREREEEQRGRCEREEEQRNGDCTLRFVLFIARNDAGCKPFGPLIPG